MKSNRIICGVLWTLSVFLISGPSLFAENMAVLTAGIELEIAQIRGLPFLKEIEHTFQTPEELQQVLLEELDRTYPGETLHILEKRLLKFGFVTKPIDLRQTVLAVFSQEIAGYYDPHKKKMVLIDQAVVSEDLETVFPVEAFKKFFSNSMGLSLEKVLLSHELAHVLQDQHFNLLSLPFEDLDPEDTTSAVRALIEGDATLVMLDYILTPQGTDSTQIPNIAQELHKWANSPLIREFGFSPTIPNYIIDNLLFSYIYGFDFVLQLKQLGGWERVNQTYHDLPASTEQILHPQKYFASRDVPVVIHLPTLPEPWQELERNTLGEFNISILMNDYLLAEHARYASAGWDGDRFALYEQRDSGQVLLAWYTTWDTQQDAREFFEIYTIVLNNRYKDAAQGALPGAPSDTSRLWKTANGTIFMEMRNLDVLILDGVPEDQLTDMTVFFWKSPKEAYHGRIHSQP